MKGIFLCFMIDSTKVKPIEFDSKEKLEGLIDFCINLKWDFEVVFKND